MKPIRLSAHALSYITKRGLTVAEVEETIRNGQWEPAELGRMECRKTFAFSREWNERVYATKEVAWCNGLGVYHRNLQVTEQESLRYK